MLTRRLLLAAGGGGSFVAPPPFPTDWGLSRYGGNPIITISGGEPNEQYDPAPFQLPSGDIWACIKGATAIYSYKSTDDGVTFAYQNGGSAIIVPVTGWADAFTVDPAAVYDVATDTVHYYFKGRGTLWAIGHATAPGSDPTNVTLDPANPILSNAAVATALGGGSVTDLSFTAPVVIDGTFHFYGHVEYNGVYYLVHGTGTTWNDPGSITTILAASGGAQTVLHSPSVFKIATSPPYGMLYSQGGAQPNPRTTRSGKSSDGVTWDFSDLTDVIAPTGSGWEKDEAYAGALLKSGSGGYLAPIVDGSGRWKFYYSGLNVNVAQTGLAYLTPT